MWSRGKGEIESNKRDLGFVLAFLENRSLTERAQEGEQASREDGARR